MQKYLASLVTREVQIKITMTHHFTYTKMAKKKKPRRGAEREQMLVKIKEIYTLYIACGNVKLFSDVVWWFPKT